MERVRYVFCGLLLALGLSLCPVPALASDGFLGGLEDLMGTRQVEQEQKGYEDRYQESYEPELREVESELTRELPEDATTVDYVNATLDSFNTVSYKSYVSSPTANQLTLFDMTRTVIGAGGNTLGQNMRAQMVLVAAGLVFMFWGVRKTIKMVMSGFRKGSMNV